MFLDLLVYVWYIYGYEADIINFSAVYLLEAWSTTFYGIL